MFNEEYDNSSWRRSRRKGRVRRRRRRKHGFQNPAHYDEPTKHCIKCLAIQPWAVLKGQIIKEIDALGGYSGIVTDYSAIQFKMLNKSKGPAVWSPRAQSDRMMFSQKWRELLEDTPNLDFYQDSVIGLIVDKKTIRGVVTQLGLKIKSKTVILTNGNT